MDSMDTPCVLIIVSDSVCCVQRVSNPLKRYSSLKLSLIFRTKTDSNGVRGTHTMSNFFFKSVGGNVGVRLSFLEIITAMIAVLSLIDLNFVANLRSIQLTSIKQLHQRFFIEKLLKKFP